MNQSSATPKEKRLSPWARLQLTPKLLLAFGMLFLFALIIAVTSLTGLNLVEAAYEETLSQGVELRRLSALMDVDLLRARRAEKNFLLRWQTEGYETAYTNYVTEYQKNIADMRQHVIELRPFGPVAATTLAGDYTQAQYETDIDNLEKFIDLYEASFTNLVEAMGRRGYDENTGFEGEFRTYARAFETKITGREGYEDLEFTYLQLRRAEKDYLLRGEQVYEEEVKNLTAQLKAQITASEAIPPAEKMELSGLVDDYLQSFESLTALDKEIATHEEEMITAARAVQPLAIKILDLGQQLGDEDTANARELSTQITTIVVVVVVVILLLSVFLAFVLARQLTNPIRSLTSTAQEIADGKFDAQAEVTTADEIGTLAQTFNIMTSRLAEAFEDVRRRALAVQTSAEVSRRLSVATNARQLATNVVEQVQTSFNYYHAHIYFFDDTGEYLVMAGGTGDVGSTMLARGHKIEKGRGLVGRAAANNESILVTDVTKEEDWLPNPLLPETRSETAIPIVAGTTVLGVLDVQQNVVNGLDKEDVELLQSLAGQVAISYQNARSFEQSKAQADLESLVNTIGQKIQRAGTVEDTLQTAIRELGVALGATRVKANIQAARKEVIEEN
jgi:putative methionine-R-sulfoxide reductase with GAF domain/CHASE3 domain sensor protein